MPRPRKSNNHLPKYVQHRHGAFYLVRGGKWSPLGRDEATALAEYKRRMQSKTGIDSLIDDALDAHIAAEKLAPNTAAQYRVAAKKIKHHLADFKTLDQVLPRHIANIRRELAETPNMANRVLTVCRIVFNRALEDQLIDGNPAIGIKRLKEEARRRLIAQDEFTAIYAKAGPRLQCAMDLWFLTGQRVEDVLRIRLADLQDDGIYFEQDKTETRLVVAWTLELRAAVARAKAIIKPGVSGLTLLQGRQGKPVNYSTVALQWSNACDAAGVLDAQRRDLRAMAATAIRAQGGDATALLGHTSPRMTERYLRDKAVPVVAGPSFVIPIKREEKKTG